MRRRSDLGKLFRVVMIWFIILGLCGMFPAAAGGASLDVSASGIDFALGPGGSISGVVEDGGGTGIEFAMVNAVGPSTGWAYTEADGSYTIVNLTPGAYQVSVFADDCVTEYYSNLYLPPEDPNVTVTDLADTPNIDFTLGPGGSISGLVEDEASNPIEGALLYALADQGGGFGMTSENGTYAIANLAPGSYTVYAFADGFVMEYYDNVYSMPEDPNVTVTDLTDTPDIDFTLGPGGSISGVVEDEGGTPLENATVSAMGDALAIGGFGEATTGPDGSYTIVGLAPGTYWVWAGKDAYVNEYYNNLAAMPMDPNVTVTDLTDTPNIDFSLAEEAAVPVGSISGVVKDGEGAPIENAEVSVLGPSDGSATTGSDGTYEIPNLAPGSYLVSTEADGYVDEYYNNVYDSLFATQVTVTASTNTPDIDFTLGPGGTITGFVRDGVGDPIEGALVKAWQENCWGDATTAADGSYTISDLAPGDYQVSAEAAGYAMEYYDGVYDSSLATLVPVIVADTTPPTTPVVTDDGDTTANAGELHAVWTASDPETGIAEYQYAIGTTAGGTDVVDWTSTGTAASVTKTGLSLAVGSTYYISVKAKNAAELWSEVGASDGITVLSPDTTAPSTPVVTDDGASTMNASQLHATWAATDAESGIAEYQYAIGTTSGGTDVVDWTSTGTVAEVTRTGLSLTVMGTYYISVKAKNGSGVWSAVGSSDGIVVADATAPTTPVVTDDGATTISTSQLHATWTSADPESGVAEYQYAIGTTSGGTDVADWTTTGTVAEATRTGLTLSVGSTYYISVKAKNGSGVWSSVGASDGIAVIAGDKIEGQVPQAGGTIQTPDGTISVEFPADALTGSVTVNIEKTDYPSDAPEPSGFKAGSICFVIEVTDAGGNPVLTLDKPVVITVKYTQADLDAMGGDAGKLVLAYYDEEAGKWVTLETTVNTEQMTLSASTTHLSTWAIMQDTGAGQGSSAWVWIIVAIAAVLAVGGAGILVTKMRAKKS